MFLRLKDFIYTLKHNSFPFFCISFLVRKPETHLSHSCQLLPRIVAFCEVSDTLALPLKEPVKKINTDNDNDNKNSK